MSQSRTLSHDSFKIHLTANFVFEVQLFLRELVFQFRNLPVDQRILHGNCDLIRDLRKEGHLFSIERVFLVTRDRQDSQNSLPTDQRYIAKGIESLCLSLVVHVCRHLCRIEALHYPWVSAPERIAWQGVGDRYQVVFDKNAAAVGKVEGMDTKIIAIVFCKHDRRRITVHYVPNVGGCYT